jgi:phage gp16-like protein
MSRRHQASDITAKQIKMIHTAKSQIGMSDGDYRGLLMDMFRANSCKDLSAAQAGLLIDELGRKGFELKTKGRPHNLNAGRSSRQQKLKKIEAQLATRGLPWSYADALAKQMCKVDSITFVPDDQLYKIVTALESYARKHGLDLGGGKKS